MTPQVKTLRLISSTAGTAEIADRSQATISLLKQAAIRRAIPWYSIKTRSNPSTMMTTRELSKKLRATIGTAVPSRNSNMVMRMVGSSSTAVVMTSRERKSILHMLKACSLMRQLLACKSAVEVLAQKAQMSGMTTPQVTWPMLTAILHSEFLHECMVLCCNTGSKGFQAFPSPRPKGKEYMLKLYRAFDSLASVQYAFRKVDTMSPASGKTCSSSFLYLSISV